MKVTLLKTHLHAGFPVEAGGAIEVPAVVGDWLIAEGIACESSSSAPVLSTTDNTQEITDGE